MLEAIKDEMKSIHDNHTFDLVKLPKGKRALNNKWSYRVKHESNSTSMRYKARLVMLVVVAASSMESLFTNQLDNG